MSKKTAKQIIDSDNHYLLQVKQNQPSLYEHIQEVVTQEKPVDTYLHKEKKRGQTIVWETKVYVATPNEITQKWESLQRFVSTRKTITKANEISEYTTFRITDLADLSAKKFYKGIRGHWLIENQLHWVRDVNFGEDKNRIRHDNTAVNIAIFNTMAINYLRTNFEKSVKYSQILFGQNVKEQYDKLRT